MKELSFSVSSSLPSASKFSANLDIVEDELLKNMTFFGKLEQAIIKSNLSGSSTIIEFDANSKLGPELIPRDPHF